MNPMTEGDEIKALQEEVQQLQEVIKSQYYQLQSLQQRVGALDKKASPAPVAAPVKQGEDKSLENFIGLRLIHLVGIVVLVIGLSIGVKYAIDKELISEIARIGLAYGAAAALYILSWRLKSKYAAFSAILLSGAMASAYFTTYGAFVYYAIMPFAAAFGIMIAITLFTVYQALQYNRQEIAILGLLGAYAIPFLISTNSDRADLFFTYIGVINSAIVFLAYKRQWRLVMYLAQGITWMLFLGWAVQRKETQLQGVGTFFALFFFCLFFFYAVANRLLRRQPLQTTEVYSVLANNIFLYLAAIVLYAPSSTAAEIGWISFAGAVWVGAQTAFFHFSFRTEAVFNKIMTLLAVSFLLVFIACLWDGLPVTFLWLSLAIGLFASGVKAKRAWLRLSGIILIGITLLKLLTFDAATFNTVQKIISYLTLGVLLLVVSFFYQKFKGKLFED
ncbi:MAG: hypothetical protein JWP69_532 [Flaviaesturariibacter sp.]|nr:hypothetical protein [Flaviaesturariibacter sp.]